MNNFRYRLEGLMGKMVIAIIILTCINFVLVGVRGQQSRSKLDAAVTSLEKSGVPPEIALTRLDGKDSQQSEEVRPYTELLNRLESKCVEPRMELAMMASALTKQEEKQGLKTTRLEGLKTL
ncbi:MAG: hypothetical protein LH702_11480, partial [Phormidesmis sp. CAN_BIN44]|nr:hypothetical protein [Phormidesmis sp. CAN_BIN44]